MISVVVTTMWLTLTDVFCLIPFLGSLSCGHFVIPSQDIISSQSDYSRDGVIRCSNVGTILNKLCHQIETLTDTKGCDIWECNDKFTDIRLPRILFDEANEKENIINLLSNKFDLKCEVMVDNLEDLIHESTPQERDRETYLSLLSTFPIRNDNDRTFSSLSKSSIHGEMMQYFFHEYRDLKTLQIWFQLLTSSFPDIVTLKELGPTPDNNTIPILEVNTHNKKSNPKGKTIVITGGIHSREWISVSTACYVIYQLLNDFINDPNPEDNVLQSLNFIVAPMINPDGYEYTWEHDRLWRKTRGDTGTVECPGFDLDRSFSYQWQPTNDFPCSGNFNGEDALEATEAKLWDKYISETFPHHVKGSPKDKNKKGKKLVGFIDFHSYSQEILYPFTYSCENLPKDIENLLELAYDLSKTVRKHTGRQYDVVQSCKDRDADISPVSGAGSLLDYMYHRGAHWGYQIKLRDTGNYGFLLPSRFIEPVGQEATNVVKYYCDFILNPPTWG